MSVILGPPNKSLLGKAIISLLQGKIFAALEPLADDEDGVTVVSRATPEQTLEAILAAFETAPAAPDRSRRL